jgi:hypothetical protein
MTITNKKEETKKDQDGQMSNNEGGCGKGSCGCQG